MVFVDTSAWYALASATDRRHAEARTAYEDLMSADAPLVTTSYVLAETMGLIQRRLGSTPLKAFAVAARTVDVVWIDGDRHARAEELLFALDRRGVSIVDAASFTVMRELGVERAFAFDEDFAREGFAVV